MSSLNVSIVQKNKSKNSFGNSFIFPDDMISQNQFVSFGHKQEKHNKEVSNNQKIKVISKDKKLEDSNLKKTKQDQIFFGELTPRKQNQKTNEKKINRKELKQQIQIEKLDEKQHIIANQKNKKSKIQQNEISQEYEQQAFNKQKYKKKEKNKIKKKNNETTDIETHIPKALIKNKVVIQQQDQVITQTNSGKNKRKKDQFNHDGKNQPNKIKFIKPNDKVFKIQQQKQAQKIQLKSAQKEEKFQSKVHQINTKINKLNSNLKDIKQNYADIERLDQDEILFKKSNIKKQRQIRDFLLQKKLQKQSRHKKLKQIKQKQKQLAQKSIQQAQAIKNKQKEQKIKKIKQVDYIKPKQRHQKFIESQQAGRELAKSLIQRYKNHSPFHLRKQRQFQTIQEKKKVQDYQILQQRKQRYQSLDLDELEEHKREYDERKQEFENNRKDQRQQQWNKIQQDNALLRDNIWKGPSHDIVDQQILERKRKEKEPQEKIKRIKNYQQFIKNNFLPKTHQPKRSNSIAVHDQRIAQAMGNYAGKYHVPSDGQLAHYDPNKKHVKKYRYFQGKAIGEVVQSVTVAKSYSQQKKIGESYLQYLKNLPKKQYSESTTEIDSTDLQMISKKFNSVTKVKRQPMPFYQQSAKKRTVSISAKPSKQQVKMVYQQLKNHDIKLKSKRQLLRAMKQNSPGSMDMEKQVNSDLVLNMQRKLDLLAKL